MLDTTNIKMGSNTSYVTLNSPSHGMIQRSHPKSFFLRFAKGSNMEDWIFNQNGEQAALYKKNYNDRYDKLFDVEVLQVMVFGDNLYLVEAVRTSNLIDEQQ